jgi:hypothetical protein
MLRGPVLATLGRGGVLRLARRPSATRTSCWSWAGAWAGEPQLAAGVESWTSTCGTSRAPRCWRDAAAVDEARSRVMKEQAIARTSKLESVAAMWQRAWRGGSRRSRLRKTTVEG